MWTPMHLQPRFSNISNKRRRSGEALTPPGFLAEPNIEKLHEVNHKFDGLEIGHSSMQGYRVDMEDDFIIKEIVNLKGHYLVAVMDGHAGKFSAKFTSQELLNLLVKSKSFAKYLKKNSNDRAQHSDLLHTALEEAYLAIDEELKKHPELDESGCTCVATIITPTHIICANVGDSRAVVATNTGIVELSEDHKPNTRSEKLRVEAAGGFVMFNRVNGELAMSRALGDFRYKGKAELETHEHAVIAHPEIMVHKRDPADDLALILACDGVWDVLSNEEGAAFVINAMMSGGKMSKNDANDTEALSAQDLACSLINKAFLLGSTDNISAVVVKFTA